MIPGPIASSWEVGRTINYQTVSLVTHFVQWGSTSRKFPNFPNSTAAQVPSVQMSLLRAELHHSLESSRSKFRIQTRVLGVAGALATVPFNPTAPPSGLESSEEHSGVGVPWFVVISSEPEGCHSVPLHMHLLLAIMSTQDTQVPVMPFLQRSHGHEALPHVYIQILRTSLLVFVF